MKLLTFSSSVKPLLNHIHSLFEQTKEVLTIFISGNKTPRPSKMYRLLFSTQKRSKQNQILEQPSYQEPDYYGNYE
jgi:hypothetical protein